MPVNPLQGSITETITLPQPESVARGFVFGSLLLRCNAGSVLELRVNGSPQPVYTDNSGYNFRHTWWWFPGSPYVTAPSVQNSNLGPDPSVISADPRTGDIVEITYIPLGSCADPSPQDQVILDQAQAVAAIGQDDRSPIQSFIPVNLQGDYIVDGFTRSMSQLLLPTTFRAHCLADMETLRRATGYQFKCYTVPSLTLPGSTPKSIASRSQVEEQVTIEPGSWIWGWSIAIVGAGPSPNNLHVLVTDACTETALSADYLSGAFMNGINVTGRGPTLIRKPRPVLFPGKVNVEIYNNFTSAVQCQLALFCAVPKPGTADAPIDSAGRVIRT